MKKKKELWTFDLNSFNGRRYFGNGGTQSYLIFGPI